MKVLKKNIFDTVFPYLPLFSSIFSSRFFTSFRFFLLFYHYKSRFPKRFPSIFCIYLWTPLDKEDIQVICPREVK